jgi:hypothetical protein
MACWLIVTTVLSSDKEVYCESVKCLQLALGLVSAVLDPRIVCWIIYQSCNAHICDA